MFSRRIYSNFQTSVIALVSLTIVSFLIFIFLDFQPRLRFNIDNAVLAFIFSVAYWLIVLSIERFSKFRLPSHDSGILQKLDFLDKTQLALVVAFVEEYFLRIFICGYLSSFSWPIAYLVSFIFSFGLYFSNKRSWRLPLEKAVEGLFFLSLFLYANSIFPIIAARFILELLLCQRNLKLLKNDRLPPSTI